MNIPQPATSCTVRVKILLIHLGHFTTPVAACRESFTQQPLLGHRCVLNHSSSLTNWTNTAHAQCVWRCLFNKDCVVISHNILYNYCELSVKLCDHLEPNKEFSVNIYEATSRTCLQEWVSVDEYDPQRAVTFLQSERSGKLLAVRRILHHSGIYPAKHRRYERFDFRGVVNNRMIDSKDGKILLLGPNYLTAWVPYSVPNVLPLSAVVGGYIGDDVLNVARANIWEQYVIRYFRKETQLGYFPRRVVIKTETMEVLVSA